MDATFSQEFGQVSIRQAEAEGGADGQRDDVVWEAIPIEGGTGTLREASSTYTVELPCLSIPTRLGALLAATSIALHHVPFLTMNHDAVYLTSPPPNGTSQRCTNDFRTIALYASTMN